MGTGSSRTRRLTVENEDPANIMELSKDVVQRLKGGENKPTVSQPRQEVPWPAVPGQYFYEPRLTSIQFRQEHIAALKENDKYWERRVTDMEKAHNAMHEVMEEEYQKAISEADLSKKLYPCDSPPCQISKKKVIECYKKNSKEPMKCEKEVEAFAQCVDVQRAQLISNRG